MALFGALFEQPVGAQRRALETVADSDLRAEVAALLDAHHTVSSGAQPFLEALDTARAGALLAPGAEGEQDPTTIGRYEIVRRLARGGMGIVYLARDPRLDRPVALKLLPPYLSGDTAAIGQLTAEARAASALDHPHVQTVYEIGDSGDGRVFIAMAYYEGETLRERIARGPLPVADSIELGSQLAEGLVAAHRAGIIHRDIKPENLLVTGDGVLKIVDFGVAKVARDGLASAGLPLGTAAYMSPEQTRGEPLDHRTDLWSMGVVLYEMLTGSRPFSGDGAAILLGIRSESPRWPAGPRSDGSASLAGVAMRCLEKDPEKRYASADAVATDLRTAAGESGPVRPARTMGRRAGARLSWFLLPSAVAAMLAVLFWRDRAPASPAGIELEAAPGIAVLPFEVRGDASDMWREGMVDLLTLGLDGAAGLRAIASRTVLARWREAASDSVALDLPRSLAVARRAGARYTVTGSVVSTGRGLRLSAQVYALEGGSLLGSVQVDGSPDSLFVLVDRLSIGLLAKIWQGQEQPRLTNDLTRITTTSLPALKAYLEGERLLRRADFPAAASAYERAVAADSTFAFALYHLGLAYGWIGDVSHQNLVFGQALRHGARLPEREALLFRAAVGYYAMREDLPTTVDLLRHATQQYPDAAEAWYLLGDIYFHCGEQVFVPRSESDRAFRAVVELDPGFGPAHIHLINNAFLSGPDSAKAARLIETYHRIASGSPLDAMNHIAMALVFGTSAHRALALTAIDSLTVDQAAEVSDYLDLPQLWTLQDTVLTRFRGSWKESPPYILGRLVDNALSQGHIHAALAYLQDPDIWRGIRSARLDDLLAAGLPISGSEDFGASPGAPLDTVITPQTVVGTFYRGVRAADRHQWDEQAEAQNQLDAYRAQLLTRGDSAFGRFIQGAARALEGLGLWRRGEGRQAIPVLVEAQRHTTWTEEITLGAVNGTIRRWLGELSVQLNRPRYAVAYFESFRNDPWMADRLGPLYEQLGDSLKARAAYMLVADAWRDADPVLQPRAQAARAAARRLSAAITN